VSNQDWVPPPPGEGGGFPGSGFEPRYPRWDAAASSGWTPPSGAGRRVDADGTPITAFGVRTAPWWKRLLALMIDGVLLLVVNQIVASVGHSSGAETVLRDVTSVALALLYYGYLNGVVGQTVGKMVMKIRVVDRDTGEAIGFRRGVVRYAVVAGLSLLLVVPEIIDGLVPLRDPLRQSLHDKAVRSVVVDTH
jgi:uncharacterized RDD family membrane protein YckC